MNIKHHYEDGVLFSVDPPQSYFGFTYWSLMIPPFKPESTLIIGYGAGTIAELIRRIWQTYSIYGIEKSDKYKYNFHKDGGTIIERGDAFNYSLESYKRTYDYVIVDLFVGKDAPSKIWTEEFAQLMAKITNKMLAINTLGEDSAYEVYKKQGFSLPVVKQFRMNKIPFFVKEQFVKKDYSPI